MTAPGATPQTEPSVRALLSLLFHALGDEKLPAQASFARRAGAAAAMSALAGFTGGLMPAFVSIGVAALGASGQAHGLLGGASRALEGRPAWQAVVVSLLLVSLSVALGFVASSVSARFSSDVTASLRVAMMRRVVDTSPREISTLGDKLASPRGTGPAPPGVRPQAGGDAVKLAVLRDGQMAAELCVATLTNLPQALFGLATLVIDVSASGSPLSAGLGVGIFLASRLLSRKTSRNVADKSAELSRADAAAFAQIGEKIAHLEDLRLCGAKQGALSEVAGAVMETRDKRREVARAVAISGQTSSLVSTLSPLVVLLSLTVTGTQVSPAEIARLLLALPLIIGRLGAVDALRIAAIEKRPVLVSVAGVLRLPRFPPRDPDAVGIDAVASSEIRLEGVEFRPPGAQRAILSQLSLTIPEGSVVALVGASGSGKSSLLRLLLRLDEPTDGHVAVGGVPLCRLDPEDLPKLFAVLGQGGKLLGRTILENVTLALPGTLPESERRAIAERVLTWSQLPELTTDAGLARRFVAAPANLSGGEQRRVLLARALAQDARVWVLDEPEAGLPKATAHALFETLLRERAGRSMVIVTHAPGLIEGAHIVVLEAGRIVGQGRHEELLSDCEAYRKITSAPTATDPAG